MNTPGGNTVTTAEHTMALLFSMARQIPQATASMKQGKWEKKKFMGVELYNKTLGIIGLGNIGAHVAKIAQGMGMKVITYDPYLSEEKAKTLGVTALKLEELIRSSDFITIHVPMTNETRNMINAKTIGMMKKDVRIINASRGGIVDEQALYDALKSGKVAAAALDVFEKEPPGESPCSHSITLSVRLTSGRRHKMRRRMWRSRFHIRSLTTCYTGPYAMRSISRRSRLMRFPSCSRI